MKNKISFWVVFWIMLVYSACRMIYTDVKSECPIKVTTWDALGYYLYLPSSHIYKDDTAFSWFSKVDQKYQLSGGDFYQATPQKNGRLVYKYLRGVSLLQTPFYYLAHMYCVTTKQYPADGFSFPYQFAIALGAILYFFISLFLLRWVLLQFYADGVVALALLLLTLASNSIQYIAIEGGQSHAYIFPLYVLILYLTFKWHQNYRLVYSFGIGLCIGLATICRPTEVVMLFIPLLWHYSDREDWNYKWKTLRTEPLQVLSVMVGGLLGIAPQLIYWKRVTGSWVYDVGSKWDFLNPHFRVLFGPEKGWFIYTPVTILFVLGLFFIRRKPFRVAVITFCLLNIYIIISWHIWRYGGSYSTRALVQSYPVFALPLAGILEYMLSKKWRWALWILGIYLVGVNGFQIYQYNQNILHYDEMNFNYYKAIYLNPKPGPKEMSLLDSKDYISNESNFSPSYSRTFSSYEAMLSTPFADSTILFKKTKAQYIKVDLKLYTTQVWGRHIHISLFQNGVEVKSNHVRLFHPLASDNNDNEYVFYTKIPDSMSSLTYKIKWDAMTNIESEPFRLNVQILKK